MTMSLAPPRQRVMWPSQGIGSRFAGYLVLSRPSRAPYEPFVLRFSIGVPTGRTRADVEAQHRFVDDFMGGYSSPGGPYEFGHDWRVLLVDIAGAISTINPSLDVEAREIVPVDGSSTAGAIPNPGIPWVVSNGAPYLNAPVEITSALDNSVDSGMVAVRYKGRPRWATVTPEDLPGRHVTAKADYFRPLGPDELRPIRAMSTSGQQAALLRPLGDRIVGSVNVVGFGDVRVKRQAAAFEVWETELGYNEINTPAGIVFDGTNDYVRVPDTTYGLNPGTGDFSIIVVGQPTDTAGAYVLSKGNVATGTGIAIRRAAAQKLEAVVRGPSATVTVAFEDLGALTYGDWFDWDDHAIGLVGSRAGGILTLTLYRDGEAVAQATGTDPGNVTNAADVLIGANDSATPAGFMKMGVGPAGSSLFGPHAPGSFHAFGYYAEALTADAMAAASYYLRTWAGYRMPAGRCSALFDTRDLRCWDGTTTSLKDLSPLQRSTPATVVGGAVTRGIPWPLERLENV